MMNGENLNADQQDQLLLMMLIQQHQQIGMMGLGKIKNPATDKIESDLSSARANKPPSIGFLGKKSPPAASTATIISGLVCYVNYLSSSIVPTFWASMMIFVQCTAVRTFSQSYIRYCMMCSSLISTCF